MKKNPENYDADNVFIDTISRIYNAEAAVNGPETVSYTHLDVYKRQVLHLGVALVQLDQQVEAAPVAIRKAVVVLVVAPEVHLSLIHIWASSG